MLEEENEINQKIDLAVERAAVLVRQKNNLPFKNFLRNEFSQQVGNPHFVQALPPIIEEGLLRRTGPWDMPQRTLLLFERFKLEQQQARLSRPSPN